MIDGLWFKMWCKESSCKKNFYEENGKKVMTNEAGKYRDLQSSGVRRGIAS
jgi:hypothetical protein